MHTFWRKFCPSKAASRAREGNRELNSLKALQPLYLSLLYKGGYELGYKLRHAYTLPSFSVVQSYKCPSFRLDEKVCPLLAGFKGYIMTKIGSDYSR